MFYLETYFESSFEIEKYQIESLETMDSDLTNLYKFAKANEFNEERYRNYVDIFVDNSLNKHATLKELKKLLNAHQTFNNKVDLKIFERLFIQLLGHTEVIILLNF